jgi:hypothetical protein
MEYFSFEFTAKTDNIDQFEETLFDNGCRDATIIVQGGEIIVSFDREEKNYKTATEKARIEIEEAGARVVSGPHQIY